jgi:hypothetical protein
VLLKIQKCKTEKSSRREVNAESDSTIQKHFHSEFRGSTENSSRFTFIANLLPEMFPGGDETRNDGAIIKLEIRR